MTYAAFDAGTDTGAPYELYEFSVPGSALVWRYTNQPVAVTYSGHSHTPAVISHGQITQQAGSIGATTSVEVADENPLAAAMLAGLSSRPVQVVIREIHRDDPDQQPAVVFTGLVTGVSFEGAKATLPCGSRYALASKRRVPWLTYQAGCNWEWGGVGCGVDRAAYRVTVPLTASNQTGRTLTAAGADGFADGYFAGGWVERAATGETRFIEEHTGTTLLLALPWTELSAVAENYYLFPGCRKNEAYCSNTFDNLDNYLGYPRLPSINPFNRSAYYQTGVPDIPDPGDTWDLPGGYQVVLSDQGITVDMTGAPIYVAGSTWMAIGLRFTPQGYAYVIGDTSTQVISGAVWLNPKNPPLTVPSLLDLYVETPTVVNLSISGSPSVSTDSEVGFDAWRDAEATINMGLNILLYDGASTSTYRATFVVRARDKAVGLVRAACTLTVDFRVAVVTAGGEGGA